MSRKQRKPLAVRQQAVRDAWEMFEDAEPNISTERLMAMVADATGEDYGDIGALLGGEVT